MGFALASYIGVFFSFEQGYGIVAAALIREWTLNPVLQKPWQGTSLPTTLDSYMFVILLIMTAAGILGGVANYFLSDRKLKSVLPGI